MYSVSNASLCSSHDDNNALILACVDCSDPVVTDGLSYDATIDTVPQQM